MMFAGAPLGSSSSSSISPAHSPGPDPPPESPTCWATRARSDLAQVEAELRRLRERHATEADAVKRSVERAVSGARREERRLLERVEQDHRDTQQHLGQVQRENMAAARVSQALLDQRLRSLAQLQQRVQGGQPSRPEGGGPPPPQLLTDVAEFLQPWEVSVSLKKVNFKPSSQPNAVNFGDIRVEEQSLSLHVGGCGPRGQPCALHSKEVRREENARGEGWTSPTGRVIRKISLSARSDRESEEDPNPSPTKTSPWVTRSEQSDRESSQDDEPESASLPPRGEDVFVSVPAVLHSMAAADKQQAYKMKANGQHSSPRSPRKNVTAASDWKLSPSAERRTEHAKLRHDLSLDGHAGRRGKVSRESDGPSKRGNGALTSPKMTSRETLTSQSCLDLTSRGRPLSGLSQSSDEHPPHGDDGRAPSPTDSLDSSYTFIVGPPHDHANRASLNLNGHLSKSAVDLTRKTRPMIGGGAIEPLGAWTATGDDFDATSSSMSPTLRRRPRLSDIWQTSTYPTHRGHDAPRRPHASLTVAGSRQPPVARSLSMSVIDGSSLEPTRGGEKRDEPALAELEEEGDSSSAAFHPRGVRAIRQFGKQGSGRADLTLPSGIHATPQGLLYIVDCGNARVQVTDLRGNVLQQVTSPTSDGSARRCRNYFDIAVNAKGLIALSCAAERALLVFSRHGRLLQTFGGSGSGAAREELEAPRGVTATRLDEFLVADIRKGSLIALKLDPKTGSRLERTVVTGFHRPYLVAACSSSGMVAVSERGNETGRVPCIKVLEPGWNTVRVLGVCAGMGPVLCCPWGICIDADGNVLVADWAERHRVLLYPARGAGRPLVTQGLSSPRGLALLPEGQLAVSDSMHHCIKIYPYS